MQYIIKSQAIYLEVLVLPADCQTSIKTCLELIHRKFEVGIRVSYVVVAGDAKTYCHLVDLKKMYSFTLSWLLPFPGDWHISNNMQSVIMKVYWDGGLRNFAAAIHRSHILTSLKSTSNLRELIDSCYSHLRHFMSTSWSSS